MIHCRVTLYKCIEQCLKCSYCAFVTNILYTKQWICTGSEQHTIAKKIVLKQGVKKHTIL